MSFITTPQTIENAFRIQMSGDPALAEMYTSCQPMTPNQPAEDLSHSAATAEGRNLNADACDGD